MLLVLWVCGRDQAWVAGPQGRVGAGGCKGEVAARGGGGGGGGPVEAKSWTGMWSGRHTKGSESRREVRYSDRTPYGHSRSRHRTHAVAGPGRSVPLATIHPVAQREESI